MLLLLVLLAAVPSRAQDASDPERDLPADVDLTPAVPPGSPLRTEVRLGGALGAAIPLGGVSGSAAVDLEAGLRMATGGGRFLPLATLGLWRASQHGREEVEGLEAPWAWEVHQGVVRLGLGLDARILPADQQVSPTVLLQAETAVSRATIEGEVAGEPTPRRAAWDWLWGGRAAVGAEVGIGTGHLFFRVGAEALRLSTPLTGTGVLWAVAPQIGYRVTP